MKRAGFTLIEMLVVIAIIAVLVSVIVPTVSAATTKAKAATDAANLKSVLEEANVCLLDKDRATAIAQVQSRKITSKCFPGARCMIYYDAAANFFCDIAFSDGGTQSTLYGIAYFSELSETGASNHYFKASNTAEGTFISP